MTPALETPILKTTMTLDQVSNNEPVSIVSLADPEIALLALRLGLSEGDEISVISRIPGGPVVLRQGHRELALGRSICKGIHVRKTLMDVFARVSDKVVGTSKQAACLP